MATKFKLKIRNPELRLQIEQITGAINALEEAATAAGEGTPTVAVAAAKSANTLIIGAIPGDKEYLKIVFGDEEEQYTFVAKPVDWNDEEDGEWAPGENQIDVTTGVELSAVKAAVLAALKGSDIVFPADEWTTNSLIITAIEAGVAGDGIATTDDLTGDGDGFSSATLVGGVDAVPGTPGVDGQIMYDSTYLYVSVGVSTETESKWKKITFTS